MIDNNLSYFDFYYVFWVIFWKTQNSKFFSLFYYLFIIFKDITNTTERLKKLLYN